MLIVVTVLMNFRYLSSFIPYFLHLHWIHSKTLELFPNGLQLIDWNLLPYIRLCWRIPNLIIIVSRYHIVEILFCLLFFANCWQCQIVKWKIYELYHCSCSNLICYERTSKAFKNSPLSKSPCKHITIRKWTKYFILIMSLSTILYGL